MKKRLLVLVVTLCSLYGCAGTEPTRYYLLTPELNPPAIDRVVEQGNLSIVVGQIRLPEYLNRTQIVTRLSDNEIELGWLDRWAEPLERSFGRILAQNIEQVLHCRCTSALGPKPPHVTTHRIEADVVRMDGVLGQKAILDVWWSIYTAEKKLLLTRRSTFVQPCKGGGYERFVQAESRALFDFSREIAMAVTELTNH